MAATPQNCTFVFVNSKGETFSIEGYVSDVAAALVRFDGGAGAGSASPDARQMFEDWTLVDFSMVTGTADTKKLELLRNYHSTGDFLRYETHLTSLNSRPKLRIKYDKGDILSAVQRA